jgi:hypothetical protein
MGKLIHGVGINDANYAINDKINGRCPLYIRWRHMITRCYSTKSLQEKPQYQGCTVTKEWHYFSNFRQWCLSQGDIRNKELDKDIMYPGNKVYSPNTCVFVEHELNSLFIRNKAKRGLYPAGVHYNKQNKKYHSRLAIQSKLTHLGYYDTPEEAHQAYLKAKIEYIQSYHIPRQTDQRVIDGLNRWIDVMRNNMYELV